MEEAVLPFPPRLLLDGEEVDVVLRPPSVHSGTGAKPKHGVRLVPSIEQRQSHRQPTFGRAALVFHRKKISECCSTPVTSDISQMQLCQACDHQDTSAIGKAGTIALVYVPDLLVEVPVVDLAAAVPFPLVTADEGVVELDDPEGLPYAPC